ncbi:MAG: hypothetical protein OCD00_03095 [Colwellia sp.]
MFNYALIENNKVIGVQSSTNKVISPDLLLVDELPEINSIYNSESKTFSVPIVEVGKIRKITKGAFRRRLTLDEKVAIKLSDDPIVNVLNEDLNASSFVDLDFDQFIQGLGYFASLDLLTTERVGELLQDGTTDEAL